MFESHPGKPLIKHLLETADYAEMNVKNEYIEMVRLLCICHDFGKYTSYFQSYLHTHKRVGELSNHSFISALFGAYLFQRRPMEEKFLPLITYCIILSHHGNEDNLDADLPRSGLTLENVRGTLEGKLENAQKQREDIRQNLEEVARDYEAFGMGDDVRKFILEVDFNQIIKDLRKLYLSYQDFLEEAEEEEQEGGEDKRIQTYFLMQQLYSALIDADKLSASNTPLPKSKLIHFDVLDAVRKTKIKNKDKLSVFRTEIYENVQENLMRLFRQYGGNVGNLFSITAPTGTGKTYCGFFAALKLRELLGDDRRIIYALPFTSIINQNYSVIAALFADCVSDFTENEGHYLMKHHCLATVECKSKEINISITQAELLLENWSAPIIVTTFVQLLETLISNRNRMLKKFHSLCHSIVLMDEVQAIPLELLPVCDYVLHKAAELLDIKIITMTATKPVLLSDSIELLPDMEKYFLKMNRTRLVYEDSKKTVEEFVTDFVEQKEDKSYLIICNTIQSSLDMYRQLENLPNVYYLSTNLLPIHRMERIEEVTKSLANGENPILVSTQAVEAGVDFDFDCVIRDIGPVDSIIQAAGRENRHQRRARGTVRVVSLVNAAGRLYGEMVYGKTQIMISRKLLGDMSEILEENYLELIADYFKLAMENLNQSKSEGFIESLRNLKFTGSMEKRDAIADFSLIDEKSGYVNVFMRIDEYAEDIFQEYHKCMECKDLEARHKGLLSIRGEVANYTLSIPERYMERINIGKAELEGQYLISLPQEGCEEYYSNVTGFMREEEEKFLVL